MQPPSPQIMLHGGRPDLRLAAIRVIGDADSESEPECTVTGRRLQGVRECVSVASSTPFLMCSDQMPWARDK